MRRLLRCGVKAPSARDCRCQSLPGCGDLLCRYTDGSQALQRRRGHRGRRRKFRGAGCGVSGERCSTRTSIGSIEHFIAACRNTHCKESSGPTILLCIRVLRLSPSKGRDISNASFGKAPAPRILRRYLDRSPPKPSVDTYLGRESIYTLSMSKVRMGQEPTPEIIAVPMTFKAAETAETLLP
jgi:hypothetical protein